MVRAVSNKLNRTAGVNLMLDNDVRLELQSSLGRKINNQLMFVYCVIYRIVDLIRYYYR